MYQPPFVGNRILEFVGKPWHRAQNEPDLADHTHTRTYIIEGPEYPENICDYEERSGVACLLACMHARSTLAHYSSLR